MPLKPKRPCSHPCCPELVDSGYCPAHTRQVRKAQDNRRGTATERGYGSSWQKARLTYLDHHPLCSQCESNGLIVEAIVVHHIQAHRGNQALFWDTDNWQALCKQCHDRITAKGK